ncbi:hypothetical protein [Terrabacter sp. MAHUQ-38]|uniref:hypothetical protein n=1 Tax=unclassified Terrabacter TaxID=2630222 RepID=UPI00165E23E4|nr:hypothetical protein [Terrabacter sp. MAHUQ-38]MBC9823977.1 hypothetical protein [Terrabacter sp. MAHUQ-38]
MPLIHPPVPPAPAAGPASGAGSEDAVGTGPVFLDVTGRRLRRVRLLGAAAAVLVIGYLGLLLSAALGGPTIDAPFLPRPAAPSRLLAKPSTVPSSASGTHAATGSRTQTAPGAAGSAVLARAGATSAAPRSTAKATSTPNAPSPAPVSVTGTPTRGATPTARPTTVPAATRSASSPTAAPGLTQRATPTKTR